MATTSAFESNAQVAHIQVDVKLKRLGEYVFRYGLVAIFLWIGLLKFTAYEAKGIEPFVSKEGLNNSKPGVLLAQYCSGG